MRLVPVLVLLVLARIGATAPPEQTVTPLTPHAEQRVEPVGPVGEQHVEAVDPARLQQVEASTPRTTTERALDTTGKIAVGILAFGVAVGTTVASLLLF